MKKYIIKHFIITVLCIGIAEYIIRIYLNNMFSQVLSEMKEIYISLDTNGIQRLLIVLLLLIQIVCRVLQLNIIVDRLDMLISRVVLPNGEWNTVNYNPRQIFVLCIIALIILVLYIIPYIIGIMVFARKVSTKIAKEEQIRNNERLDFERRRNLLISDIAHDLRTPITTVNGYAKALSDGMITDKEKQREYLLTIQKKSDRMEELIKLLFEYVKLDSQGFTLDKEPVDICELLRENAALVYSDMEESGMDFLVDIPEEKIMLELDKLQISRVISNLLVNAMRHNPPGTKVCLSLKTRPGVAVIDVADDGQNIPEEEKATIFEPFSKADKSRSDNSGSGLGLSIAKKIIDMHGWILEINDSVEDYTKAFQIIIWLK